LRRIIDNDVLTLLVRLAIGGVFIYASAYKILDPGSFARSIWYYHMVPGSLINLMALILPWLEFLCGLTLILGIWYRGSVVLINLLTIIFIAALATAVARGISIDCGCFKAARATNSSAIDALWRDIVMVVFTLQLLFSRSKRWMLAKS
jgi:uncharacterized membrane protein YphA (DoxX/SURF4 family)